MKAILVSFAVCSSLVISVAMANEELMEKSGCISCHRIDQKLIGPAFKSVATKYKSASTEQTLGYLMNKVREGGEGVWGDIPMAPNPVSKISDDDLKTVLSGYLGCSSVRPTTANLTHVCF